MINENSSLLSNISKRDGQNINGKFTWNLEGESQI